MNDPIILSYNGQSPTIDKNAWVAPGAVLHGCTLESGCLVGIGARVLDRAVVGRQFGDGNPHPNDSLGWASFHFYGDSLYFCGGTPGLRP